MGKFVQLGGSKNPVGYCWYHHFTISKNQLKQKKCLEKNCPRFEKYKGLPYWKEKERKKQLKKSRKKHDR